MSKELKRNDPCHCGSEAKYKNCHAKRGIKKPIPWIFWGVLLVLIGAFSLIPNNKENGLGNQYTSKPYKSQNIGKTSKKIPEKGGRKSQDDVFFPPGTPLGAQGPPKISFLPIFLNIFYIKNNKK